CETEGATLVRGLVARITRQRTAGAAPRAARGAHEGVIASRTWRRGRADSAHVAWIIGTTWMPFQLPTFVTPAFPGYVSGHSTFSRAAAEVLVGVTGSEYFPGGLAEWTVKAGSFKIEAGPSAAVVLQWAPYYDAADQAGQSR